MMCVLPIVISYALMLIASNGQSIDCYPAESCLGLNITSRTVNGTFGPEYGDVTCWGERSCADATVNSDYSQWYNGFRAGENAKMRGFGSDTYFFYRFVGASSGYGAEILCGDGHRCSITCNSNACDNLTLTCVAGDGTCTWNRYCDQYSGGQSEACPDGEDLSFLPSLNNLDRSGVNDLFCSDWRECVYDTITNKNNLYCMGSHSCYYATLINQVNNIYAYGYYGVASAQISNVLGNIYCGTYSSCRDIVVDGVAESIIAVGYQVLAYVNICNVFGDIYGLGDSMIYKSTLCNINGKVTSTGYKAFYESTASNINQVR